jgi:hypothetical protein
MARTLSRLITSAALSTCLVGAASAGCPITGDEMDMMTVGVEAPCFTATPAVGISPAGGATTPSGIRAPSSDQLLHHMPVISGDAPHTAAFTTFGNFTSLNTTTGGGNAPDHPD